MIGEIFIPFPRVFTNLYDAMDSNIYFCIRRLIVCQLVVDRRAVEFDYIVGFRGVCLCLFII